MDVLEAIHTRRTIFKFKPGVVYRKMLLKKFLKPVFGHPITI